MRKIPLTRGMFALVDDSDYDELSKFKWQAVREPKREHRWYAARREPGGKRRTIFMHQAIMNSPVGYEPDHIDGNGLNNQRENLRLATRSQNAANRGPNKHSSKYKGVQKRKNRPRWIATITKAYQRIYLGEFSSEDGAALAYDKAARNLFGEFAHLNFPDIE